MQLTVGKINEFIMILDKAQTAKFYIEQLEYYQSLKCSYEEFLDSDRPLDFFRLRKNNSPTIQIHTGCFNEAEIEDLVTQAKEFIENRIQTTEEVIAEL